jgi:hypothetical protein
MLIENTEKERAPNQFSPTWGPNHANIYSNIELYGANRTADV